MKRLATAALAMVWLSGMSASAAESTTGRFGVPYWKPVGSWIVLLLPLGNGALSCTALTRMISARTGKYSVGFALSPTATHFYLNDPALPKPAPRAISLAVDGHKIAELSVLLHEPFGKGEQLLMADLPGAMLAQQILPAMVKGRSLDITAGSRHYAIPIADFAAVVTELQQCAMLALAQLPELSSKR
jgi:hypothetical protein